MDKAKPFCIPKHAVWEAYKRVKANHGAAGVDGQSIADFEENLSGNLFKIWNRMCSGSYYPPPVMRVEIPKASGVGVRPLGIPTVADRIAQTVGKNYLEPILEAVFDEDSYGYVNSWKSGERVMALLRRLYAKLRLKINESKSAVASVFGRKFLGYSLWAAKGGETKRAVAYKALKTFKQRVRQLTRRTVGKSMAQVVEKLRPYLLGWKSVL